MTPQQFERVERLFEEAAALPATDRAAYLREHAGDDPTVLRKVQGMLAQEQSASRFLETPAMGDGFHVAAAADLDRDLRQDFDAAGRFRLDALIGEGGFGSVYRAEQLQPVRRAVAIKVVKPGMDTRRVLARFEAERQTLARMNHPGIAAVFDAGATHSGRPYFVMELAEGVPITRFCDQQELGVHARIDLFLRVCAAVQHAHTKGIIHRDLKPSNVLVTLASDGPAPKVIDFGIAKAAAGDGGAHTPALTLEQGQFMGTPEYMSPEQAAGERDIDTRADIYSLGVILYELLSGTTPLNRASEGSADPQHLRKLITDSVPPPPSTRVRAPGEGSQAIARLRGAEPAALSRTLRGDLDWIAMKAIEKERARRYDTVNSLADDLRRFLAHEPVLARPPTTAYRVSRFARRHRLALVFAGAVAVVLIAGIVGTAVGLVQALAARDAQARQLARADEEAATAVAIAAFLNDDLLAAVQPGEGGGGKDTTVRQVLDAAAQRIDGRFPDRPLVEAGIRLTIGRAYTSLAETALAEPQLHRALELRRGVLGPDAAATLDASRALGNLLSDQGRAAEADAILCDVLARRRAIRDPSEATRNDVALDMHFVARNQVRQGRSADAERMYRELIDLRSELNGPDHQNTLAARGNLIGLLQSADRLDALEPQIRATLDSQTRSLGHDHTNTLYTRSRLALIYFQTGRFELAEAEYTPLIADMEQVFGPRHPYTLYTMGDFATVYTSQNRLDDAEELRTRVVEGLTAALGPDHSETQIARELLGDVYTKQGRLADADAAYRRVLEGKLADFGPDHDFTLATKLRLARNLLAQDQPAEAEALIGPALAAMRGSGSDRLAEGLVAHARVLLKLGSAEQAEAALREAVGLPLSTPRARRGNTDALLALADLCDSTGRSAEAAQLRAGAAAPSQESR